MKDTKDGAGRFLTTTILAALALSATLVSGASLAARGGYGPHAGPGGHLRRALASLGLSDDQKTKIQAVFAAEKPAFQVFRTEGKAARQALKATLAAPTPDPAVVGLAAMRVDANRKAAQAEGQKVLVQVRALLTPDQNAKLTTILGAFQSRWGDAAPAGGPSAS